MHRDEQRHRQDQAQGRSGRDEERSVHVVERERLVAALTNYDFVGKVWPSDANFLLVRFDDAAAVMRRCQEQNVLLRHFGGALDDCIRISVGSRDENDQLLRALDTLKGTDNG